MILRTRRLRPALASVLFVLAACGGGSGAGAPVTGPRLEIETSGGPVLVRVELADTEEKRQRGLMGRESLDEDAGMVFLHEQPTTGAFWMKDTLIPLSIAFWDERGEILAILDMEPCEEDPCEIYDPGVTWIGAVEVNQGFFGERGVEVGDTAELIEA